MSRSVRRWCHWTLATLSLCFSPLPLPLDFFLPSSDGVGGYGTPWRFSLLLSLGRPRQSGKGARARTKPHGSCRITCWMLPWACGSAVAVFFLARALDVPFLCLLRTATPLSARALIDKLSYMLLLHCHPTPSPPPSSLLHMCASHPSTHTRRSPNRKGASALICRPAIGNRSAGYARLRCRIFDVRSSSPLAWQPA